MSTGKAFRAALTEKYSKLAAEVKTHSNPEKYIHSKYFDKSSEYYETNLTDTERRIAYNYEMQMCRTGKINGVNFQDSLFRGIEVDGDSAVEDSGKVPKDFKQQMKDWIHDLVSTISARGFNNVLDMTLSILYGKNGLKDMKQLIIYQYEADGMSWQWYSVL